MFRFKLVSFLVFLLLFSLVFSGCTKREHGPEKMASYGKDTFYSEKFDFSLEFPDTWKDNFNILEEVQKDFTVFSFVYVNVPGNEYPIFRLLVYPFDVWQQYKNGQELILNQQVFAYNNDYVFVLVRTFENPYSLPQLEQFNNLKNEVGRVISSFKFVKNKDYNLDNLKIYFGNTKFNPEMLDCRLVYPVLRSVSGTLSYPEQALRYLFAGPTEEEKEAGFTSFFNTTTAKVLRSIKIVENVALVNLKDIRTLIPNANSSCGSAQFLAQIEKTLKEFPDIYQVYLAIDEVPARIYEWLQIGCSEQNFYCDETPFKPVKEADALNIEVPIKER